MWSGGSRMVTWCMSGSLNRCGGENVPDIPGACATRKFTYLARGAWEKGVANWICALAGSRVISSAVILKTGNSLKLPINCTHLTWLQYSNIQTMVMEIVQYLQAFYAGYGRGHREWRNITAWWRITGDWYIRQTTGVLTAQIRPCCVWAGAWCLTGNRPLSIFMMTLCLPMKLPMCLALKWVCVTRASYGSSYI